MAAARRDARAPRDQLPADHPRRDRRRSTRPGESFEIGGSRTLRSSDDDAVTLIGAGITLHECLAAADELASKGIAARVIDLYSVKPVDAETLLRRRGRDAALVTVEDHWPEGGIGETVAGVLAEPARARP